LITLVVQGLSLKPLVRYLNIRTNEEIIDKRKATELRLHLAESVLGYIDMNYPAETENNDAYKRVRDKYQRMVENARRHLENENEEDEEDAFLPQYRQMLVELVYIRRRELAYARYKKTFNEELIREREWELDLEEARLKSP
jgi:CPA1 family monovalent cation:H+ antiporter